MNAHAQSLRDYVHNVQDDMMEGYYLNVVQILRKIIESNDSTCSRSLILKIKMKKNEERMKKEMKPDEKNTQQIRNARKT